MQATEALCLISCWFDKFTTARAPGRPVSARGSRPMCGAHRDSCQAPSRLLPLSVAWFRNLPMNDSGFHLFGIISRLGLSWDKFIARVANRRPFHQYHVTETLLNILDAFSRLTGDILVMQFIANQRNSVTKEEFVFSGRST